MMFLYKIFTNTVMALLYCFMAQAIYNFRRDKAVYFRYVTCTAVGINLIYFLDGYIMMSFKALFFMLAMAIAAYLILKLKVMQAIVSAAIFIISLAVGDISAVLLLIKVYGYQGEIIRSNLFLTITADVVVYGMVIISIFLIRLTNQAQEMTDKYKRGITLRMSAYMFVTFVVIAVNYSMYIRFIETVDKSVLLVNVAIMWVYLISSLYINFTNSELALKEQQYDQQQDYIKTIDNLINDYRRLKHSYANTIYSFYGYIQENDLDGLKVYYSEVMDEAKKMDSNLLLALQRIKVYAIFGLLWNKISEAEGRGIDVGVQVAGEVHEAGMRLSDLCEVLGNYLDNAIEAAAASEMKKMNISIADDDGYLTIRVENSCLEGVDAKVIHNKGYSTKGTGRGYGLFISKRILSKYINVLNNTLAEDGVFKQELVIKK